MHRTTVISAKMDNTLLYVIQLCLAPITLHPSYCNKKVSHFETSQYQVYDTAHRQPVFVGKYRQDINVWWLLHNVNFFKYQLKAEEEGLLAHAYEDLESDQVPQAWVGTIKAGVNALGCHWKGAYSRSRSFRFISIAD
jgi:1,2-phenylacetyl-CoA epoxidase catalytic subunit